MARCATALPHSSQVCLTLPTGLLAEILKGAELAAGRIVSAIDEDCLARTLGIPAGELHPRLLAFEAPFDLRRRGVELRIVAGERSAIPDPALGRALRKAHRWAEAMRQGKPLPKIAEREGVTEAYIRTRVPLAFLSPKIQAAILYGTQPTELTPPDQRIQPAQNEACSIAL